MSVVNFKPTENTLNNDVNLPKTQPDDYLSTQVDHRYQDLQRLSPFVSGYALTVDYYGQILGEDNSPKEVDPSQSTAYQQYYKINNLSIKVESTLSLSTDTQTSLNVITGSANIYPEIIPNTYDYFTVYLTRNRKALFRVTSIERKSINRSSFHFIEYSMVGYVDEPTIIPFYEDLERKVVNTYVYDSERLLEGSSPLIREEIKYQSDDFLLKEKDLITYIFTVLFNNQYQTFPLPGQDESIFDMFIVEFFKGIVNIDDHPNVIKTKIIELNNSQYADQPQFWNIIKKRSPSLLKYANKYMGVMSRRDFNKNSYIGGGFASNFKYFIYPKNPDLTSAIKLDESPYPLYEDVIIPTKSYDGFYFNEVVTNVYLDENNETIPVFKPVDFESTYVLSPSFYTQNTEVCLLEKITLDFIHKREILAKELNTLIQVFYDLPRLEQFYYFPIIIVLIREYVISSR